MNVLGLSAFYHESTAALLVDGELVAAASEERFSRVKHDPRLPVEAFRFCLERAGLSPADLDAVAYYERPVAKLSRQLAAGVPRGATELAWLDPAAPELAIRERLGFDGPLLCYPHHESHAASAFFFSGFEEAALLTADGVGEWATTTYGLGRGAVIDLFEEVAFPHSLGLFYSTITAFLGFGVNDGEYKVMGLAPYGEPRFAEALRRVLQGAEGGGFRLDLDFFDFLTGPRMFSPALVDLLGLAPRQEGERLTQAHADLARSAQLVLEELLLDKVRYLHRRAPVSRLCMAGGVGLNCVANGRILREGPFAEVFIQPAAGDAGGALGAAALATAALTGGRPRHGRMEHAFWGPSWSSAEVAELLAACGLAAADFRGREGELIEEVAGRLAAGQVLGWFQGCMELGPRALGGRSLLANPADPGIRERLNRLVKKREAFRPFAPAVLADRAPTLFELEVPSPFMLTTCRVRNGAALPGITHVDGSARPQTVDPAVQPRFAALLAAFERRTGIAALVNTSFNVRGEPIVCSPVDALFCFATTEIDALVIEDFVLDHRHLPTHLPDLLAHWRRLPERAFAPAVAAPGRLYTFV